MCDMAELAARMQHDMARNAQEYRKLERRVIACEERLNAHRFQHWKLEVEARREIARLRVLEERVLRARRNAEPVRWRRAASV